MLAVEYPMQSESMMGLQAPTSDVWAVFVTFDSPAYARACVDAIRQQSHAVSRVLVIDNGPPGTSLRFTNGTLVEHIVMPSNVGPAGGFAEGMSRFLAGDAGYLWLMDDDLVPERTCLEMQLSELDEQPSRAIVMPTLVDYQGKAHERYGWACQLVPRSIIAEAGPPISEYFWGSEDGEWLLFRVRDQMSIPILRSPNATAKYDARAPMRSSPGWKYYYEARNGVHSNLYRRPTVPRWSRWRIAAHRSWKILTRAARDPGGRRIRVWMALRGLADGILSRLGARIVPSSGDRLQ